MARIDQFTARIYDAQRRIEVLTTEIDEYEEDMMDSMEDNPSQGAAWELNKLNRDRRAAE